MEDINQAQGEMCTSQILMFTWSVGRSNTRVQALIRLDVLAL